MLYIYCDVLGFVQWESDRDEITIMRSIHLQTHILNNPSHRLLERDIVITGQTGVLYTRPYDGCNWSHSYSCMDTRDTIQVLIGE